MAKSLSTEAREAVRQEASNFLARNKIRVPPFPVELALEAQQLRLAETTLADALRRLGVDDAEHYDLDAMLNVNEKSVTLREDLHPLGKKWGCVHEIGHSFLPWHRDLLFYCPILRLPAKVQKQMELEADAFTSDCIFLGDQFMEQAKSQAFGIRPVIELARDYGASITSALRRYVEENPDPCCLLVWRCSDPGEDGDEASLSLRYFVRSQSFNHGFPAVGKTVGANHVVTKAYVKLRDSLGVTVPHAVSLSRGGLICSAETFYNSYSLFTLVWQPKAAPTRKARRGSRPTPV